VRTTNRLNLHEACHAGGKQHKQSGDCLARD
jgi:hypothetical protein